MRKAPLHQRLAGLLRALLDTHTKTCTQCGVVATGPAQMDALFYRRRKPNGYEGYRRMCKECNRSASVGWRAKNPDAWKAIQDRHAKKKAEAACSDT